MQAPALSLKLTQMEQVKAAITTCHSLLKQMSDALGGLALATLVVARFGAGHPDGCAFSPATLVVALLALQFLHPPKRAR
jgi:hypothetical protein